MLKYRKHLFLFLIISTLGCRASQILLPEFDGGDQNWLYRESTHFCIYYRPGSEAEQDIEWIARYLDRKFVQICQILEVEYANKITFLVYNSAEDLKKNIHQKTWGFAAGEYEAVAYYYPSNRGHDPWLGGFTHETTHVIIYWTIGVKELNFLSEGIAEAIEKYFLGTLTPPKLQIHVTASSLMKEDKLLSLGQLSDNRFFQEIRQNRELYSFYRLYDQCGSFVRYLIDQDGIDKFKRYYAIAKGSSYRTAFRQIYDKNVDEFEKEWHEFLRNY